MKKKELKNLAKKIAQYELMIERNENVEEAQNEIMNLTSHVSDFQDIDLLDEFIQDYIEELS